VTPKRVLASKPEQRGGTVAEKGFTGGNGIGKVGLLSFWNIDCHATRWERDQLVEAGSWGVGRGGNKIYRSENKKRKNRGGVLTRAIKKKKKKNLVGCSGCLRPGSETLGREVPWWTIRLGTWRVGNLKGLEW